MWNPSRNIPLLKCVSVCAWFVHREWMRDKSWEKQTDCGGFDVHLELGPQNRYEVEKKQYHRTNVSLQTTTVEQCVGLLVRVWYYNSQMVCTHSFMCADYRDVNHWEWWSIKEVFSIQQTTDTPLKGNKTAPTTSKCCCILFSLEETCVFCHQYAPHMSKFSVLF